MNAKMEKLIKLQELADYTTREINNWLPNLGMKYKVNSIKGGFELICMSKLLPEIRHIGKSNKIHDILWYKCEHLIA